MTHSEVYFVNCGTGKELKAQKEYCAHIGLAGQSYEPGGWAFYGRAQNGWPARFRKADMADDTLESVVANVMSAGTTRSLCELGDLNNPNQYADGNGDGRCGC